MVGNIVKSNGFLFTAALVLASVGLMAAPAPPTPTPLSQAAPPAAAAPYARAIDQYCVSCHSYRLKTGGLSLEGLDAAQAGSNPELWEKVVRKLQARSMPPQGVRRPDEATYHAVQAALEASLDA